MYDYIGITHEYYIYSILNRNSQNRIQTYIIIICTTKKQSESMFHNQSSHSNPPQIQTNHLSLSHSSNSEGLLKKYHQLTSPLINLKEANGQEYHKQELKKNVSLRLDFIKKGEKSNKIFGHNMDLSYAELKATSVVYNVPEFSPPEVTFEVSEKIKKKVDEVKNQMITHFPQISKSSNYAPRKMEHQMNHRSVLRQLEDWLKIKLKNPPCNYQESVEYKNMIMGIGMKELIRIINKRCLEEGKMAEEIWQLTWSICKEIIVYLSKRAKKCEQVLEEELSFLNTNFQKQFQTIKLENQQYLSKIASMEEENTLILKQLEKLKKKNYDLKENNRQCLYQNENLHYQFKNVLEENLAIYLQIGDKSKRDWIKKMYKQLNSDRTCNSSQIFKDHFKQTVNHVLDQRSKLEEITGQKKGIDNLTLEQYEKIIETDVVEKKQKRKKKNNKIKRKHQAKANVNEIKPSIDDEDIEQKQSYKFNQSDEESNDSCQNLINTLKEQFRQIDSSTQTELIERRNKDIMTEINQLKSTFTEIQLDFLHFNVEIGINTEEFAKEDNKKKKGKENSERMSEKIEKIKDSSRQKKDKLLNNSGNFKEIPKLKATTSMMKNEKINLLEVVKEEENASKQQSKQVFMEANKTLCSTMPLFNVQMPIKQSQKRKKDQNAKQKNQETEQDLFKQSDIEKKNLQQMTIHEKQQNQQNKDLINEVSTLQNYQSQPYNVTQHQKLQQKKQIGLNCNEKYICANCFKLISENEDRFVRKEEKQSRKISVLTKNKAIKSKKQSKEMPDEDMKRLQLYATTGHDMSDRFDIDNRDDALQKLLEEGQAHNLIYNRQLSEEKINKKSKERRNSAFMHDIAYKRQLEETQKSNFFQNSPRKQNKSDIDAISQNKHIFNKISYFKFLMQQLSKNNIGFLHSMSTVQQQISENLEHYFELVKEINSLSDSDSKLNITQKSVCSTIEKSIFPIMNELMGMVKKACKHNKVRETMNNFTSLPSIVYNRMSRKYGVKILAIKNMKILLLALKTSEKFTQKYKMIQLMMFTDCKSPHSEDLFIYLLVMGLLDPYFSSTRVVTYEEANTVRSLCQEHLSKVKNVYAEFERLTQEEVGENLGENQLSGVSLLQLIKSIITSYRLLKIQRIQELGFIFLMLKKDNFMEYKTFIYFLSTLNIQSNKKVLISKKLMEFCDINPKDKRIGISENMFSKFLMNCESLTLQYLNEIIQEQMQKLSENKETRNSIASKVFLTHKSIITTNNIQLSDKYLKESSKGFSKKQRFSILSGKDLLIQLQEKAQTEENASSNFLEFQLTKVVDRVKLYSSFTFQICSYLENSEENRFLSEKQQNFIKDYLLIHIVECELEKTVGIMDYLSSSMLQLICINENDFKIQAEGQKNQPK